MFHPIFSSPRLLHRELDGILSTLFAATRQASPLSENQVTAPTHNIFPALNVSEEAEQFHLDAELPGVSAEELEVSVVGNELKISGERKAHAKENYRVRRREISTGKFARTLKFPCELDATNVEATFKDGVLTLRLPKAPSAKPKKIQVRVQ